MWEFLFGGMIRFFNGVAGDFLQLLGVSIFDKISINYSDKNGLFASTFSNIGTGANAFGRNGAQGGLLGAIYDTFRVIGFIIILFRKGAEIGSRLIHPDLDRESFVMSFARLFVSIVCILYSWELIGFFEGLFQDLYNAILVMSKSALIDKSMEFTADVEGAIKASKGGVLSGIVGASLSPLAGIIALILMIMFIKQGVKLISEIVERYLVGGILTLMFPIALSSLATKEGSRQFGSFIQVYISQYILMVLNVLFFTGYVLLLKSVPSSADGFLSLLLYCTLVLNWAKIAQHLDEYARMFGFNTLTTGNQGCFEGMFLSGIMIARGIGKAAQGTARMLAGDPTGAKDVKDGLDDIGKDKMDSDGQGNKNGGDNNSGNTDGLEGDGKENSSGMSETASVFSQKNDYDAIKDGVIDKGTSYNAKRGEGTFNYADGSRINFADEATHKGGTRFGNDNGTIAEVDNGGHLTSMAGAAFAKGEGWSNGGVASMATDMATAAGGKENTAALFESAKGATTTCSDADSAYHFDTPQAFRENMGNNPNNTFFADHNQFYHPGLMSDKDLYNGESFNVSNTEGAARNAWSLNSGGLSDNQYTTQNYGAMSNANNGVPYYTNGNTVTLGACDVDPKFVRAKGAEAFSGVAVAKDSKYQTTLWSFDKNTPIGAEIMNNLRPASDTRLNGESFGFSATAEMTAKNMNNTSSSFK